MCADLSGCLGAKRGDADEMRTVGLGELVHQGLLHGIVDCQVSVHALAHAHEWLNDMFLHRAGAVELSLHTCGHVIVRRSSKGVPAQKYGDTA